MPKQKPGKSEQTVGTPRDLLDAIVERYGPIGFDLAATKQDSVIPSPDGNDHFGPGSTLATNALFADWSCISDGILWLNPPFRRIEPWAKKCAQYSDERIALLVPLSTADWALKHVYPFARVLGLFPRVTFAGHKSPYPKDMMLAMYGTGFVPGFETWRWKS
jgi:hypothetical protein